MQDAVTEIKQKLNIVDVVSTYVTLKKSGRNYKGNCPFHGEKTPSFMVSQELQIFKCFGCGVAGDIFGFTMQIEGIDFVDALTKLAERAGIKLERTSGDPNQELKKKIYYINEVTAKFYHYLLNKHAQGKPGLSYLKDKRKLSDETISNFMLGYAPESWNTLYNFLKSKGFDEHDLELAGVIVKKQSGDGYYDKFRGRITFPLIGLDGKIVGFTARTILNQEPKYLNTSETLVFQKSQYLYGMDKAKVAVKQKGAVFVEGQMDVIGAHQAGITNVVATSGTSLAEAQLRLLSRYTDKITFCFDTDNAGMNAALRAIEIAEKLSFKVYVLQIPAPYKDLDELAQKNSEQAQDLVENHSTPIYDFYLAVALKRHDKNSAFGKKDIVAELAPLFSKISDKVMLEHYVKQIASETGLDEGTIYTIFTSPTALAVREYPQAAPTAQQHKVIDPKIVSEADLLAVLMRLDVDISTKLVYKLSHSDFVGNSSKSIFEALKTWIDAGNKTFNIQQISATLDTDSKMLLQELSLMDFDEDPSALANLGEKVLARVKRESLKRTLKRLGDSIKVAELEKNSNAIKELTEKVTEASKELQMYSN